VRVHLELRQCWCRPRSTKRPARRVVVHNSADGREYFEPDRTSFPARSVRRELCASLQQPSAWDQAVDAAARLHAER
jgi:hypothetical protein